MLVMAFLGMDASMLSGRISGLICREEEEEPGCL